MESLSTEPGGELYTLWPDLQPLTSFKTGRPTSKLVKQVANRAMIYIIIHDILNC